MLHRQRASPSIAHVYWTCVRAVVYKVNWPSRVDLATAHMLLKMNRHKLTCITDPLTVNTQPETITLDKVMFVMLLSQRLTVDAFWFFSCGKTVQRHSTSLTCLKCLSHLILEPSEKGSPRWKDEAIQNGNIYPPSRHSFSSSLSVRVSFVTIKSFLLKRRSCFWSLTCTVLEKNDFDWHDWFCLDFNTSKCQNVKKTLFYSYFLLYLSNKYNNPSPKQISKFLRSAFTELCSDMTV